MLVTVTSSLPDMSPMRFKIHKYSYLSSNFNRDWNKHIINTGVGTKTLTLVLKQNYQNRGVLTKVLLQGLNQNTKHRDRDFTNEQLKQQGFDLKRKQQV